MLKRNEDRAPFVKVNYSDKVYRQWRNWKNGTVIENIVLPSEIPDVWWDKEFEAVVLLHSPDDHLVFCDPLSEVINGGPRYTGCVPIRLDRFNQLVEEYGGENVRGPGYYKKTPELTLSELLAINTSARRDLARVLVFKLS